MSQTETDRKTEYPKVGDVIEVVVGRAGDVQYIGVYDVTVVVKQCVTMELRDVRVVKKSDLPI